MDKYTTQNIELITHMSPVFNYVGSKMRAPDMAVYECIFKENYAMHKLALNEFKNSFLRAIDRMEIYGTGRIVEYDSISVTYGTMDLTKKTVQAFVTDSFGNVLELLCDGEYFRYVSSVSVYGVPRYIMPRSLFDYVERFITPEAPGGEYPNHFLILYATFSDDGSFKSICAEHGCAYPIIYRSLFILEDHKIETNISYSVESDD